MNSSTFVYLFVIGLLAHLIADFFLQDGWQAANKARPAHPALLVHGVLHGLALLTLGFPFGGALWIAFLHMVIDQRGLLRAWRTYKGQSGSEPGFTVFIQQQDQAAHLIVIGLVAAICAGIPLV